MSRRESPAAPGPGQRLRDIRKANGLRQVEAAKLFGVVQSAISTVERGACGPSAEILAGIERLGYSGSWLLTGEGNMKLAPAKAGPGAGEVPIVQSTLFRPPDVVPSGSVLRPFPGLIGGSVSVFGLIGRVIEAAATGRGVLFVGEPGTGAELAANGLNEYSLRSGKPFVALDCPNDQPNPARVEAAVVSAHTGTLFLYEVTELSAAAQQHLVKILSRHDLRLVGATSRTGVRRANRLLPELLESLPLTIETPTLRHRRDDVPMVADHLLRTMRRNMKRFGLEFELAAWQRLVSEDYRAGNFRQLEAVIEACVSQERTRLVSEETLERILANSTTEKYTRLYGGTFHAAERTLIQDALINHAGDREHAAAALGIDKFFLVFLMFLLGISLHTGVRPQYRRSRTGQDESSDEADS